MGLDGASSRRLFLQTALGAGSLTRLFAAQDASFSTTVKVVNILASVRDKKGQIVRGLTRDDFVLEEDGRPQTIKFFSQESDLPLTLGLLVDTSMSQMRVLPQERVASYKFLDRVLRPDKDFAFVIHFDGDVELLQDLTNSRKQLEKALGQIEIADPRAQWGGGGRLGGPRPRGRRRRGGTLLFDSVLLASDDMMRNQSGRKAVIMLSDGVDNGSRVSIASAIESAQRADTLIYGILFADKDAYGGRRPMPRQAQRLDGKKVLQKLADETGGGFFEVSKKLSIDQIYTRIDEELRYQYSIGYSSDRTGEGYRAIKLTAKKKNLTVQSRDGYYAKG